MDPLEQGFHTIECGERGVNMDLINESDRRALICHLVEAMRSKGSWAGETQIQKSVMFLQKLLNVPLGYDFVLYLHGPFSFELRSELTLMRVRLYLDVEPRAHYGASFTLGRRGEETVKTKPIPPEYQRAIEFVAKEISWNDVRSLEQLSTAYFLQDSDLSLEREDVATEMNRLKPHISVEQARRAVDSVDDLRSKAVTVGS